MIIVKGSIPVKMDYHQEAVEIVEHLAETSRREPGCLAYEVYIRADAPEVIMVWQQWASMDALETHFESEHVDEFLDAIPDLIDGEVTSARFDVREAVPAEEGEEPMELPRVYLADNTIVH